MSEFPSEIRKLLEDPSIVKAGVGILGDASKLRADFGVNVTSCLDLSCLAKLIDPQWSTCKGPIGLARLMKAYEGQELKKPKSLVRSNWERFLTQAQQDYAANDAIAGLSILRKLDTILISKTPPPNKAEYLFNFE
ncbi:hypothetical protein Clacol_003681 [Clathrus columnatus]|uniref:3'-5' exonuclease n=1 Tax=Clathrus columnatus TaxID=1419009 RepID=A0AAV5A8D3_9AGAM|nr:hypothetical protein Clacol_003681 [Clathrus columnatus]